MGLRNCLTSPKGRLMKAFRRAAVASLVSVVVMPSLGGCATPTTMGEQEQWQDIVLRHENVIQNLDKDTPENAKLKEFMGRFDVLRGMPFEEILLEVDRSVDIFITYASDRKTFDSRDYWATPVEMLKDMKGDCEDFATLKYYVLRYLGVPADKMAIAVVGTGGGKLNHATLLVDIRPEPGPGDSFRPGIRHVIFNGMREGFVMLDNDDKGELKPAKGTGFKPHYSMNENGAWKGDTRPAPNW